MARIIDFLQDAPIVSFEPGELIIEQGGPAQRMFVLVRGEVQVSKNDVPICKISKEGSIFAEISALLGVKRTATMATSKPSRFVLIDDVADFLSRHAGATLEIARLLAHRVQWLTANYADELGDGESTFWHYR